MCTFLGLVRMIFGLVNQINWQARKFVIFSLQVLLTWLGYNNVECLYIPCAFLTYTYTELLGPIEGSARNAGTVVPVSKKQSNGSLDSAVPSKSERLNSPNTSNWEPDVRMLLSTSQWLKVHVDIMAK